MPSVLYDYQIFSLQLFGGISRYFCEIARRLNRIENWESIIFCPLHINGHIREMPELRVMGYPVAPIPKTGVLRFWINRSANCLYNHIVNKHQIIHHTYYHGKNTAGRVNVVTVYDMINEVYPDLFRQNHQTPALKRRSVIAADCVICISHHTKKDLLRMVDLDPDKVFVTQLGFSKMPEPENEMDWITALKPYILYVGQRGEQKNFKGLLQAYGHSKKLSRDFKVLCVGGGGFTSVELDAMASLGLTKDRVVQLSGDDSLLACAYRNASLFVYPSFYEGFGIPPLEAMSFGCPVACSHTSSLPEVVGAAAGLFDPKDEESIMQAMESIVYSETKSQELIASGRQRVQGFSWERCARETVEIYSKFI